MFDCLVSPSGSIFLLVPRVMDMQLERSTIISVVTITLLTQLTPAWSAPGGMFRRAESTTYPAASAAEQSTNNAEVNATVPTVAIERAPVSIFKLSEAYLVAAI